MKKILFSLFAISISMLFIACEGDDDSYAPLVYEICDASLTFSEDEQTIIQEYSTSDLPDNIRSYIASEFAGYAIITATAFEVSDGSQYIEIMVNNNGRLLFDSEGNFLCGDEGLTAGGDEDDEYINPEDLPQAIWDYIAENYPDATIEEAELEDGEYEVELSNDVELCFDSQGNFIGDDC